MLSNLSRFLHTHTLSYLDLREDTTCVHSDVGNSLFRCCKCLMLHRPRINSTSLLSLFLSYIIYLTAKIYFIFKNFIHNYTSLKSITRSLISKNSGCYYKVCNTLNSINLKVPHIPKKKKSLFSSLVANSMHYNILVT